MSHMPAFLRIGGCGHAVVGITGWPRDSRGQIHIARAVDVGPRSHWRQACAAVDGDVSLRRYLLGVELTAQLDDLAADVYPPVCRVDIADGAKTR